MVLTLHTILSQIVFIDIDAAIYLMLPLYCMLSQIALFDIDVAHLKWLFWIEMWHCIRYYIFILYNRK